MIHSNAQYREDGYFIAPEPVLPDDVVMKAVEGMDAIRFGSYDTGTAPLASPWNPGDDVGKLCKIEMPQIANKGVYELVTHPALAELAAEATGASMVQVWWVQLLYKPPVNPKSVIATNVGWHQDRQYWSTWDEGSELFTAWVAVSDVCRDSGPMKFVRGSHKWGLMNQGDFFGMDHEAQRREIIPPDDSVWEEREAILSPGGVSFHHSLTYHASGPNTTNSPRRSFAIHMRTERSRPRSDRQEGHAEFIDLQSHCPVIYGDL